MLSFLYVYSDHSILECYNLFSGVELSMRSFFVIISAIALRDINYDDVSPLSRKQPHVAAPQDKPVRSNSNANSGNSAEGYRTKSGRLVRKPIRYQDNM